MAYYEYDPWGNVFSSGSFADEQSFRYAGYQYDSETGLYYLKARYYDPRTARFLSRDPNASYNNRNPYIYVENNPVNLVDPTGLEPNNIIYGKLINKTTGEPIPWAAVRIDATVTPTNGVGEFRFTKVEDGIYTIHYDARDFVGQTQVVEVRGGGEKIMPTVIMSRAQPSHEHEWTDESIGAIEKIDVYEVKMQYLKAKEGNLVGVAKEFDPRKIGLEYSLDYVEAEKFYPKTVKGVKLWNKAQLVWRIFEYMFTPELAY